MNYRSVAQLSDQMLDWAKKLPPDIDLIVGIPRSGLLAANLLSLYRNLPLTDLDGLIEGRIIASVAQRKHPRIFTTRSSLYKDQTPDDLSTTKLKVLVVDDSIRSGQTMRAVKERIAQANLPHDVYYGAVYVLPDKGKDEVDFYCEELNLPRIFEWNIMHSWILSKSCVDIDGVLCRDPFEHEDDDGVCYERFVSDVDPIYFPSEPIGTLVTCRLEKYREATESWLARHGIAYEKLVMMDYPDKAARKKANAHGAYKAKAYKESGAELFIESSLRQATQIAAITKKAVFCVDTMQMIYPDAPILSRAITLLQDRHKHDYMAIIRKKVRGKSRHLAHLVRTAFSRQAPQRKNA